MDIPSKRIREWLLAAMATKNLTVAQLAAAAKVNKATIYRALDEAYNFVPSTRTIEKLSIVLGPPTRTDVKDAPLSAIVEDKDAPDTDVLKGAIQYLISGVRLAIAHRLKIDDPSIIVRIDAPGELTLSLALAMNAIYASDREKIDRVMKLYKEAEISGDPKYLSSDSAREIAGAELYGVMPSLRSGLVVYAMTFLMMMEEPSRQQGHDRVRNFLYSALGLNDVTEDKDPSSAK